MDHQVQFLSRRYSEELTFQPLAPQPDNSSLVYYTQLLYSVALTEVLSRSMEIVALFSSVLVRPHVKSYPALDTTVISNLKCVQRKTPRIVKGLENKTYG